MVRLKPIHSPQLHRTAKTVRLGDIQLLVHYRLDSAMRRMKHNPGQQSMETITPKKKAKSGRSRPGADGELAAEPVGETKPKETKPKPPRKV